MTRQQRNLARRYPQLRTPRAGPNGLRCDPVEDLLHRAAQVEIDLLSRMVLEDQKEFLRRLVADASLGFSQHFFQRARGDSFPAQKSSIRMIVHNRILPGYNMFVNNIRVKYRADCPKLHSAGIIYML